MFRRIEKRARIAGTTLVGLLVLGSVLVIRLRTAPLPAPRPAVTEQLPVAKEALPTVSLPSRGRDPGMPPRPQPPVDPQGLLEHGSKEPLIPPTVHVDAELAPGSTARLEPLTPPVLSVEELKLAPGGVVTSEPL